MYIVGLMTVDPLFSMARLSGLSRCTHVTHTLDGQIPGGDPRFVYQVPGSPFTFMKGILRLSLVVIASVQRRAWG